MRGMQVARNLAVLLVGLLCVPGLCLGAAIKGKVVFVGTVPPPKKVDITIDQYVCGTAKDAGILVYDLSGTLVQAMFPPNAPHVGLDDSRQRQ